MDSNLLVRETRLALADRRRATEASIRKVRSMGPETRKMLLDAVENAIQVVKTEDAENKTTAVAPRKRDMRKSVAEACACVISEHDTRSGFFGRVSVTALDTTCQALKKAGFSPDPGRKYAVKVVKLEWPATTGRINGIAVDGTPASVAISSWKREADIAARAGELGVGPKVHAALTCKHPDPNDEGRTWRFGIIVMDALDRNIFELSSTERARAEKQLPGLLKTLHDEGILHGDANGGNLMVDGSGRVFIVDYGFSTRVSELTQHDFQDVADARVFFDGTMSTENILAHLVRRRVVK